MTSQPNMTSRAPVETVGQQTDQLGRGRDVRELTDSDLDRRIQTGWDTWCELLDELVSTGGMLPSPQLVSKSLTFLQDEYWRAEDARIEALRRQLTPGRNRGAITREV